MHKVIPPHEDQEVEAHILSPKDFYLPYRSVRSATGPRSGAAGRPYYTPEVALEAEELSVLRRAAERAAHPADTPLGGAARSALRKLSFDLPEAGVGEEERALVEPTPPTFDKQFAALRGAVEQRRAVRCRYYAIGRDKEEERVIEPYGLMLSWGHWACVGRRRGRAAMRGLRVDRMEEVALGRGKERDLAGPTPCRT